ncbi:MAG: FG-GAP repeat protein [Chloroflexi bacterium]|nr:FG-GAP repeat protein [Chloroflexota bacterium]
MQQQQGHGVAASGRDGRGRRFARGARRIALLALTALAAGLLRGGPARGAAITIPLEPDAVVFGDGAYGNLTVRALADLNADGASDALLDYSVKARGAQQNQQDVLLGRADWPARTQLKDLPGLESLGIPYIPADLGSRNDAPFYGFRAFLDADGDGVGDLASYAQQRRNSEILREETKLYLGGAGWRTPDISRTPPQLTIVQDQVPQDLFQAATRPMIDHLLAGDFDGDGDQDLAIGTCHVARGMTADTGQAGTLRLYLSPPGGPRNISLRGGQADVKLTGAVGPTLGCFEAFAGDFDGDGRDDLLVSAPNLTEAGGSYAALLLGRTAWPAEAEIADLADRRFVLGGQAGGARALDARDLDGDGLPEVVVEYGQGLRRQGYCAWPGGPDRPALADAEACPLRFSDQIYDAAGDLDADGRLDLVFTLPRKTVEDPTLRYAVLLGPLGPGPIAIGEAPGSGTGDLLLETANDQGRPEWWLADLSGDGRDDLILSRPSAPNPAGDDFAGRIEILLGPIIDPALLPPTATPEPTLVPPRPTPVASPTPEGPAPTATPGGSDGGQIYLPLGLRGQAL